MHCLVRALDVIVHPYLQTNASFCHCVVIAIGLVVVVVAALFLVLPYDKGSLHTTWTGAVIWDMLAR